MDPDAAPGRRREQLREGLGRASRLARAVAAADADTPVRAPQLFVLLRHALGQAGTVEVTGSTRLARALTGQADAERADPDGQVIDLTAAGSDDTVARVMAAVGRRRAQGVSLVLLLGAAGAGHVEEVRRELGRAYGVEAIGEIAPALSSGDPERPPITVLAFGARRAEPLALLAPTPRCEPTAPTAWTVSRRWPAKSQRARGRLREWALGEPGADTAPRDETDAYVGYTPLSKAGAPFSMVPRSLEGALGACAGTRGAPLRRRGRDRHRGSRTRWG